MKREVAIFAGGCFWCIQHDFDHVKGVISTRVGYIGGKKEHPSYEEVSTGKTGHVEAIEVVFDPDKVSYVELLDIYWHSIDPTRSDGQFCDIGSQYKPVIFCLNDEQKRLAEFSKRKLIESQVLPEVLVEIKEALPFYPAEEYHQTFYKKSPAHYESYSRGSRRKERLKEIWEKRK